MSTLAIREQQFDPGAQQMGKIRPKLRFSSFSGDENFGTILSRRSRIFREHQRLPPD